MERCYQICAGHRLVGDTRDHGPIELGCAAVAHPLPRTSSLCSALGLVWRTTGAQLGLGACVPRTYTSPARRRLARVLRRPRHAGNGILCVKVKCKRGCVRLCDCLDRSVGSSGLKLDRVIVEWRRGFRRWSVWLVGSGLLRWIADMLRAQGRLDVQFAESGGTRISGLASDLVCKE